MLLTAVSVVLFVSSVSGTPTGQAKCSWGPSYWCQNYKQALECNALEHCRGKVWAVKDEEACDICQQVVPMVRNFLAKNSTQAEVVTLAEQACEDIAGPFASMCKSVIDKYEPVIWDSVLELMLVISAERTRSTSTFQPKIYVRSLKVQLADLVEIHLGVEVDPVDGKPSRICARCLLKGDPKQVCTALGLCSSMKSNKVDAELVSSALPLKTHLKTILAPVLVAAKPNAAVIKSKPFKASAECILCEFIMKELDTILKENATKEEIQESLDEVCSLLPDTIKTECDQFVKQYAPAIIDILAQELDPSMVCTSLGVCGSNKHSKVMEKTATFVPGSNETCAICEAVMTYLKNLLADNTTKQEILSLLKEVCDVLPPQLSSQCNNIVSEYGPAILDLIATADPHELCLEIGLCTSALKKEEFCFLGASYWCANKRNAISCNAFKHCTDHVWK